MIVCLFNLLILVIIVTGIIGVKCCSVSIINVLSCKILKFNNIYCAQQK